MFEKLNLPAQFKRALAATVFLSAAMTAPVHATEDRPTVVATIAQIADVVKNLTGDSAEVSSLMGEGVDPHSYRMNRKDIARLTRADLVLYNGLYLEAQMEDALHRMGEDKPVLALGEAVNPQLLLASADYSDKFDPHIWMDVSKWTAVTKRARKSLLDTFPSLESAIEANSQPYIKQLNSLQNYVETVLATVPENSRVVISAHDAFNYFGDAYGFEVLGIQGLSTASEAGLKRIEDMVDLLVERKIQAVFVESSVADRNLKALIEGAAARGHTVRIGGTLFSDAMGAHGTYEGTYIGMLDHNATVITRALGGEAPAKGMQGKLTVAPAQEIELAREFATEN
ncbi:metal ABC transporter solute-binding protein, Zn/Mn family [Kiloniella sp. b19]|uniref:metal ABC transporter solute-binding protein, Zn/Mn family n=1 Tax=Kiloniella sp. GXU_MW_B19 TaxID=3141326 RepID=UPI0031D2EAE0